MARPVSKVLKPIKGRRMRVTKLDGCGRPVYGDASVVVSSGFVSVAYTANSVETDEINVTNANGDRCLYEPGRNQLVGYSAEITFCEVDFELFSLLTGATLVYGADDEVVGFAVDTSVDVSELGFALEVWTGNNAGDACTNPAAQGNYGYILNPFLQGGTLGDFTIENGGVSFVVTGAASRDGSPWGVGPYDVTLDELDAVSPLLTPINTTTPFLLMQVGVAPPTATIGARPLMDPASTAVTAITPSGTGNSRSFTVTPADISVPVYYDFGDGTWDYIEAVADGATSHTFPGPGTYTVRATSNGVWASVNVTIT